jgi:site-specific DNA-adenine methylase
MKPLLRWAGGKTRLLPELVARLPEDWRDRTYVEPFAGSAALFFHLTPERAVLGDANTKEGFGPQQQEQLCAALERSSWYAKVMVSQADTPYIRRLYRDWHIHEVSVRRSISADGTRPKAKELIICSY